MFMKKLELSNSRKSATFYSINLPFDVQVAEKILNVI